MLSLKGAWRKILLWIIVIISCNPYDTHGSPLASLENEDEVIFEKVLQDPEELTVERKAVPDGPPVCLEEQLPQKENGGQCLDLLAALHSLLIDDLPGAIRKETQAPVVRDGGRRVRRNAKEEEVVAEVEMIKNDLDKNGTNTTLGGLFDFPIDNEESIFVDGEHQHVNENGSIIYHILTPDGGKNVSEGQNKSTSPSQVGHLEEIKMTPPEFPAPKPLGIHPGQTADGQATTPEPLGVDETLIWEVATLLAHLNLAALNGSTHHFETTTMDRIETLLTKLLPVLAHMKSSVRKNDLVHSNGSTGETTNNSTKGSNLAELPPPHLFPYHPPLPPFAVSLNATGPTSLHDLTTPPIISSSTDFDPSIISGPIVEPMEPPETSSHASTSSSSSLGDKETSESTNSPATIKSYQIWPQEKLTSHPRNMHMELFLRQKLLERAPHFLPREQSTWWKAEKQRQQACVLLSSIDPIRQKCCLTLRLICPEYAAVIQGQAQRLVDGARRVDGDSNAAVFERHDDAKRGRRTGPLFGTKHALIADTLARISSLLAVLIRGDND